MNKDSRERTSKLVGDLEDLKTLVLRGRSLIEAAEGQFDHYDRDKYGNASEIGGCIRKQWYDRNVDTDVEQDWGFARRGSHGEKYVVESLLAANVPLLHTLNDQLSLQDDTSSLSATPDGVMLYDEDDPVAVEIKTIDPRVNLANLPREDHVTQLQVGIDLIRSMTKYSGMRRGIILYMDASNFNVLHQFNVLYDAKIARRMSRRAKTMLRSRTPDALDREGKSTGACRYCSHKERCGVIAAGPINQKVTRSNRGSGLHAYVSLYVSAKGDADAAKRTMDACKADIMSEMEKRNVKRLPVGGHVVSLKPVAGRTGYDTEKAIADGVNLEPYKTTGASSVRLEVGSNTAA